MYENRSSKILLIINDLEQIKYPVDGYILGYEKYTLFAPKYFSFEEIKNLANKDKTYILLNALIHENLYDDFILELEKIMSLGVKVIVQDIGALSYLKEHYPSDRYLFNPYTLICNAEDYKTYCDIFKCPIFISDELSLEEKKYILQKYKASIMIYGYEVIYQSYRKVISLYEDSQNKKLDKNLYIKEDTRAGFMPVMENQYGSSIFKGVKLNLLDHLKELANAEYMVINSFDTTEKELAEVINTTKKGLNQHEQD